MSCRARRGLKRGHSKPIWHVVTLRPIFAILVALGLLFTPFGMGSASAMAAPADHHAQMMKSGHCGDQPSKKDGKAMDKSCCVAMCSAIAVAPTMTPEPHVFTMSPDLPSIAQFHHSYLAKLPTPPPRGA